MKYQIWGLLTEYEGLSPDDAEVKFETLGKLLNDANPWGHLDAHHEKLRARAGYWAALGAKGPRFHGYVTGSLCQWSLPQSASPFQTTHPTLSISTSVTNRP